MPSLTYDSYLSIPELLSLQKPHTSTHDELLFIVAHQTCELWFKQILSELNLVSQRFEALVSSPGSRGPLLDVSLQVHRCSMIMRLVTDKLSILETILPMDFHAFRGALLSASAVQSQQFHRIGSLCNSEQARSNGCPHASPEYRDACSHLQEPSLRELLFRALEADGHLSDPMHDETEASALERRTAAIRDLYVTGPPEWVHVCERLSEFDELSVLWRVRHLLLVERMIGGASGTGGTEGTEFLKASLDDRFFPELWRARTLISSRPCP